MSGINNWRPARKKPVTVEFRGPYDDPTVVETIEGDFEIDEDYIDEHGGYVIIRGVEGEIYPCGLDVFRQTFEQVDHDRDVDDEFWSEYERRVSLLGYQIIEEMKEQGCYAGEDTFDGREWCEENGIPESVFANAVDAKYEEIEYGVSPMYPWLIPEEYR